MMESEEGKKGEKKWRGKKEKERKRKEGENKGIKIYVIIQARYCGKALITSQITLNEVQLRPRVLNYFPQGQTANVS